MQISLRSHLVAGVAAVVGAGVVTIAPAAHMPALPVTAGVALTGFDNPIVELIDTAELVQTYLLASYYNGANFPTPGAGEANWPGAGMDQTGGDVLNYALAQQNTLGKYTNVGLLPYIVNANEPILQQLEVNWLGYLNTVLTGVTGAANAAAAGVWDFPAAVIDATKLAFSGQVQEAFAVLADAIITPIVTATNDLFGAVGEVVRNVVAKLVAVVKVIPTNLTLFGGWLIGGGTYLVKEAVATGRQWLQELGSGDIEGAWNTAVTGLLGPTGMPGKAFNVSLGAGVQTGPIVNPQTDIKTNFIPSLRTAIQGTLWNTQEALTTEPAPKVTPAAVTPAPAAAELAAAKVEAATEQQVGADNTPEINAPSTRRSARAASSAGDSADAPARAHRSARAARGN
ncbi:MAG: hypothetical protein KIH64_005775 [Mycobacterium sp.]|nr:hypothetical protein [Mycobacterium sp.]